VSQSVQVRPLDSIQQAAPATLNGTLRAYVELTKPGITRLVTITSGVGFVMAAVLRSWQGGELALTAVGALAGTAISASGANALNQWLERDRDARMRRTARRPLPQGRVSPAAAAVTGSGLCVLGVMVLWLMCGPVPAMVSLATILSYLLLYTPLKPVTPLATLVGAVPGALPPLIGWTAAAPGQGLASLEGAVGWVLFAIMFVWQIPHFLAIGWMYRDDYAAGGYRPLPVLDPTGERTARSILAWSAALLAVSLAPAMFMSAIPAGAYAVLAGAMGVAFLAMAAKLRGSLDRADARKMFLASIMHLPVLLVVLVTTFVADTLL
jgi:protoheme IX farnesyltransferase